MQFKNNTAVFTSDDREVGKIDRVVLDPRTKEVTHVVVRKGLLFTEDKVVPIDQIAEAGEERVVLRQDINFETLPDFEENHYITLDGEEKPGQYSPAHAQPMYWYPFQSGQDYQIPAPVPFMVETERNIPDRTVAVKEGAKVTSADGEHVGNIERVFVDPDTDRVTTFLVSKGLLLKEKMLIPGAWVTGFGEREVKLAVGSKLLEKQSRLLETGQQIEELSEDLSQR
jgi:uncharacterized protein YrrD